MLSTIAPIIAARQVLTTSNDGMKNAASFNMAALMTIKNSPKVRIQMGNVIILRNVPTVELINPITNAAIKAPTNPRT